MQLSGEQLPPTARRRRTIIFSDIKRKCKQIWPVPPEKTTCFDRSFFQLNPPLRVGEIIFVDEISCGDEIRLDGGRVELISSA